MKQSLTILFFLAFSFCSFSQVTNDTIVPATKKTPHYSTKHFSILGGYTGCGFQYAELGLAVNEHGVDGHHPFAWAIFASTELYVNRSKFIIAPKIGAWAANGGAYAISAIYYTNGQEGSLRIRPEYGLGINVFKLTYGYNIPIINKNFQNVNKHCLTFTFLLQVKKLKETGSRESFGYSQ